jgi:hypothetical protein
MRIAAMTLGTALLLFAAPANAGPSDPVSGFVHSFFYYQAPPPPVGGDCNAIAAAVGPDQTWYGEFSGKRITENDAVLPYAARGCFESEIACRIWQQRALTYAEGTMTYTSCRRGARW